MVTGTEVLTGRVRDRNGPWLSDRLLELGVELAHITICGDRPEDMEAQLRFLTEQGVDLIVTTGGLGPTADDLTIEVVARFAGLPLHLDEGLEARIAEILRPLMARFPHLDFDAVRVTPNIYTPLEEIDTFVMAMEDLLKNGIPAPATARPTGPLSGHPTSADPCRSTGSPARPPGRTPQDSMQSAGQMSSRYKAAAGVASSSSAVRPYASRRISNSRQYR